MLESAYSRVTERLLAADPGLIRLRTALRIVMGCFFSAVLALAWVVPHHEPITIAALAVLFAMISPLFLRDPRRRDWFISLFSIFLCADLSFLAAALLAPHAYWADVGFLVVFFLGILCQACGPRALGCALTSVVTYYLGLYLAPSAAHIALMLPLSLVGLAMVALVGRVLFPVRPERILRRAIHTVRLRARVLLAARPAGNAENANVWQNQLSSLNEAAMALEEQLSLFGSPHADTIRERLFEIEVAAGECRFASDMKDGQNTRALETALERLQQSVSPTVRHKPSALTLASAPGHLPEQKGLLPKQTWAARIQELQSRLSWLPACRATTAAMISMVIGHSLSPERWFWAVITTFVVFMGTRSRADTVFRGLERVGGTIAGALTSAALAITLHAHPVILICAMTLCVFGWAYFILNSYSRGVFFITVVVGLVYAELGFAIGPLIELRIAEVLVGCFVSFAVAFTMMPLRASKHIDARMLAVLSSMRNAVQACGAKFEASSQSDGASHAAAVKAADAAKAANAAIRQMDRSWHELRVALRPFQTQNVFVWNPSQELIGSALMACLHWTRQLGRPHAVVSATPAPAMPSAEDSGDAYRLNAVLGRIDSLIAHYKVAGVSRNQAGSSRGKLGQQLDGRAAQENIGMSENAAALQDQISETAAEIKALDASAALSLNQLDNSLVKLIERLAQASVSATRLRWAREF